MYGIAKQQMTHILSEPKKLDPMIKPFQPKKKLQQTNLA